MRLLTCFWKNCKLKSIYCRTSRHRSSSATRPQVEAQKLTGDPSLVEISASWGAEEEPALRAAALRDMQVLPEFVSPHEEAALLAELEPQLKRMRYEFDHWDNAIQGYRETERSEWSEGSAAVLARVKALAFPAGGAERPLPHAHVLDLAAGGHIKPHVDAVRFCGNVIAGLCLASSAVMRLQHCSHPHRALDALLARRSLYIMRGVSRYEFTHAVLGGEHSWWRGERVPRARRVAVICRSRAPRDQPRDQSRDQPRDQSRDQPRDQPRDQSRDQPRDQPRDQSRDQPRDQPRDQSRDQPRDQSRDQPAGAA